MPPTFTPRRSDVGVDSLARRTADDPVPATADHTADPLVLPAAWQPQPRPPLPIVASVVPVIGAVVVWAVTGSILALLLAALGPVIALASVWDARRGARRDRRRHERTARHERDRVVAEVEGRQERERARRWARHPDVAGFLAREEAVWRSSGERAPLLVVGAGDVASTVRVTGGDGDPAAAAIRADAARLRGAPVTVGLEHGIAVVGTGVLADAVHRALVAQACLVAAPGRVRIVGDVAGTLAWADALPHRRVAADCAIAVTMDAAAGADAALVRAAPGEPLPPACGAVLTVESPRRARLEMAGEIAEVAVEAISIEQAQGIAQQLAERARTALGMIVTGDEPIGLTEVLAEAPTPSRGALPAVIGRAGPRATVIDLVADGPHAVVAGMTGTGKSELLITWVLALAATHSTREVNFLLADFKGGTAFDALSALPHVTGVLTDLDGGGARRAMESLRAEVRWREAELARVGARDITDPRVELPRLVVIVDEFATLVAEHPELNTVFVDVAARGRALGLHLVLGTQRAAGVLRENVLANCPLRVSLRVADPADSRIVVGTSDAAELPGGVEGRGIALVRRAGDLAPSRVRIALSSPDDIARIADATRGPAPRRPWLPSLPAVIRLDELLEREPAPAGRLILGLADEPEQQRQRAVGLGRADRGLLILGGPGSGRTTALQTLAAQAAGDAVHVPATAEGAWDAVAALATGAGDGRVVVIDDLDALIGLFPPDHAHEFAGRLERVFRGAGDTGTLVLASVQRMTGAAARLGELLPLRLTLPTASRADHLAAGGDPASYSPDAPPGRAHFGGRTVQIAVAGAAPRPHAEPHSVWTPTARITGIVTRRPVALAPARARWTHATWLGLDEHAADPGSVTHGPLVLVGDPDDWQRHWRTLAMVRSDHDLVIDTSCAAEYRVLAASRDLPPFCAGAARAWLISAGAEAARIVLPAGDVRTGRPAVPLNPSPAGFSVE